MLRVIRKRMRGEKGFTLIELLVVIIIIAILAAIAIPTFLGQRNKAYDASAKSLVRNGMTAIESYWVDGQDFSTATAANLALIEPSISWVLLAAASATAPTTAVANLNQIDFSPLTANTYQLGTKSKSGTTWGVAVDKTSGVTYYKGAVAGSW